MTEKLLHFLNYPLFIIGCFVSTSIRLLFPGVRYGYDVTTFADWGTYANKIKDLYSTECFCNYPIIGLLSSTGLLKLFHFDIAQFMIALSFVDLLNVILVFFILKNLKVNYAGIWAFVIAVIPSTWAGAALWGQIDNVGQSFLLLIILLITVFYHRNWFNKHFVLFIILEGVLFSFTLLTKQLLLFSIVPLGIFVLHIIYQQTNSSIKQSIKYLILFAFTILFPIILFDAWLNLPAEFSLSHLQRVLLTGSDHLNNIAGNGFNIWVLFFNDLLSSSSTPFIGKLSPKYLGIALFLFTFAVISYFHFKNVKSQNSTSINKSVIINYLLYLALINLSFNVFLTGTHDRYLYHFYPFLLIVIIALGQDFTNILKNKNLYIALIGACLYGAFILSILLMVQPIYSNKLLAIFHFCLLVYLFIQYLLNFQKINNAN